MNPRKMIDVRINDPDFDWHDPKWCQRCGEVGQEEHEREAQHWAKQAANRILSHHPKGKK